MSQLLRYFVALIAAICLFLAAFGALLVYQQHRIDSLARLNNEFFAPSRLYLTRALVALDAATLALSKKHWALPGEAHVPVKFGVQANLIGVEQNLLELIRLRYDYDYLEIFGLPSAALQRLQTIREQFDARLADPSTSGTPLDSLTSLRNRLTQLERIYELGHARLQRQARETAADSSEFMLTALLLLVLVSAPLIVTLSRRLRLAVREEIRSRRELEEAKADLEAIALFDSLTGLGNRNLFRSRLDQAVEMSRRSGRMSALLYLDLDHFKRINDSMGHDTGDEVLRVVGARIRDTVRGVDTVARLGGDEFIIIVSDMAHDEDAAAIAGKLLLRIAKPISVGGYALEISASIGIALMPTDSANSLTLMKHADIALYKAKDSGRNNIQFFAEEMSSAIVRQTAIERDLRNAINEERLDLYYQPQVDLDSGKVHCMEALLQLRGQDGGAVSPADFIPVAENSGLMPEIGDWVLNRACRDALALQRRGAPDLRLSVNLSARQFRDPRLLSWVERACLASGLRPESLELEITETMLVDNIAEAVSTLSELQRLGVTVAIDDFGIGYSSLNYLKQLPIDTLKVDRSFIRDIETDKQDRSIVDAILAMAHSLSLKVVAEGIENTWQLRYLAERHCDLGQGYLFSKPLPVDKVPTDSISIAAVGQVKTGSGRLRLIEQAHAAPGILDRGPEVDARPARGDRPSD